MAKVINWENQARILQMAFNQKEKELKLKDRKIKSFCKNDCDGGKEQGLCGYCSLGTLMDPPSPKDPPAIGGAKVVSGIIEYAKDKMSDFRSIDTLELLAEIDRLKAENEKQKVTIKQLEDGQRIAEPEYRDRIAELKAEIKKKDAIVDKLYNEYLSQDTDHQTMKALFREYDTPNPSEQAVKLGCDGLPLETQRDDKYCEDFSYIKCQSCCPKFPPANPDSPFLKAMKDGKKPKETQRDDECPECAGLGLPPTFPGADRRRCNTCGSTGKKVK